MRSIYFSDVKHLKDIASKFLTHEQVEGSLEITTGAINQTASVCVIGERKETTPAGSDKCTYYRFPNAEICILILLTDIWDIE